MTRIAKERSMLNALRVIGCSALLLTGATSAHAEDFSTTVGATPKLIVPAATNGLRFGTTISNEGPSQGSVPLGPSVACSFVLTGSSTPVLAEGAPGAFTVASGSTWAAPISGAGYTEPGALWCVATPAFDLATAPLTVDAVQR